MGIDRCKNDDFDFLIVNVTYLLVIYVIFNNEQQWVSLDWEGHCRCRYMFN